MVEGANSSMVYLIYCKNFCKCHHVSPAKQLKKRLYFVFTLKQALSKALNADSLF
jgi:hypothetical protein